MFSLTKQRNSNCQFFAGASDLEHQTHSAGEDKMSETSNSNINCLTDLSGEHKILDVTDMEFQTDSTAQVDIIRMQDELERSTKEIHDLKQEVLSKDKISYERRLRK